MSWMPRRRGAGCSGATRSAFLVTSPRLRGEVEIRVSEFRVRGTLHESISHYFRGDSPSPHPLPASAKASARQESGARERTGDAATACQSRFDFQTAASRRRYLRDRPSGGSASSPKLTMFTLPSGNRAVISSEPPNASM